jgi:methyl-accepting chemotaxis protein
MFKNMKLTGKIVGSIVVTLVLTSGISFWITNLRVEAQAEEAFRDKVRQITGMASATRAWFSGNIDTLVPGQNFQSLNQVPVVAAWSVAQQYADRHDMTFRTPSLTPRNPKNQADDFERKALEAFQQDSSLKEFSERRVEGGKEVMRYAQPVRATQDCLFCHGDPAGQKDPFGHAKEGMKVGDLRGAFSVTASTESLVQNARSNSIAIFLTSFFSLLAAAGVVLFLVRKLVIKPLSASVELADNIAHNNLAIADLPVEAQDEIGEATASLNQMKQNLRKMIGSIATTADQLASASEELSAGAVQSASTARTQSDQTRQVATAMHEMSATVLQVSDSSQRASSSSHNAAQAACQGGTVVEETLGTMRKIADSTHAVALRITELGKNSEKIGKIIAVIDEIADQTNLLALNAAIEAARAGEQGRGFAVVADEVRKLADRTTKATKEIAAMIEAIQVETTSAVQAMELGSREVQVGVDKTAASGDALKEIIAMSTQVGDMITQIATAATQQTSTTDEINSSVAHISDLTQTSAVGADQTARACADLSSLAFDLQNLVSQFQLESQADPTHASTRSRRPSGKTPEQRSRDSFAQSPSYDRPPNRGNGYGESIH